MCLNIATVTRTTIASAIKVSINWITSSLWPEFVKAPTVNVTKNHPEMRLPKTEG